MCIQTHNQTCTLVTLSYIFRPMTSISLSGAATAALTQTDSGRRITQSSAGRRCPRLKRLVSLPGITALHSLPQYGETCWADVRPGQTNQLAYKYILRTSSQSPRMTWYDIKNRHKYTIQNFSTKIAPRLLNIPLDIMSSFCADLAVT